MSMYTLPLCNNLLTVLLPPTWRCCRAQRAPRMHLDLEWAIQELSSQAACCAREPELPCAPVLKPHFSSAFVPSPSSQGTSLTKRKFQYRNHYEFSGQLQQNIKPSTRHCWTAQVTGEEASSALCFTGAAQVSSSSPQGPSPSSSILIA
jgi:hypothetical protein